MIEVKSVSKEFVSPKKYPGLKGAIKGLFSNEKVSKVAVDDISFSIKKGEIVTRCPASFEDAPHKYIFSSSDS